MRGILETYLGREDHLFATLEKKYGVEGGYGGDGEGGGEGAGYASFGGVGSMMGAPLASNRSGSSSSNNNNNGRSGRSGVNHREVLVEIYTLVHSPDNVAKVDAILSKYVQESLHYG